MRVQVFMATAYLPNGSAKSCVLSPKARRPRRLRRSWASVPKPCRCIAATSPPSCICPQPPPSSGTRSSTNCSNWTRIDGLHGRHLRDRIRSGRTPVFIGTAPPSLHLRLTDEKENTHGAFDDYAGPSFLRRRYARHHRGG